MKLIFIHGNGGCTAEMHWYLSAEKAFQARGFKVIRRTLPDNKIAHQHIWIPYIRNKLKADKNSVLIGHSSGAIAAMRFAEQHPVHGIVLVSAYHTHMNDANEQAGGWFDTEWNWQQQKKNTNWIMQFASSDDPYIPIEEAHVVRDQLNSEYYEFTDRGHFTGKRETCRFPELVTAITNRLKP